VAPKEQAFDAPGNLPNQTVAFLAKWGSFLQERKDRMATTSTKPFGPGLGFRPDCIYSLEIGHKAMGALSRLGCGGDVSDVAALTDEAILSVRGVGAKTLAEIRWALARHELEHSDAEHAQAKAEKEFAHEFECALSAFMHSWFDEAPAAAAWRMNGWRSELKILDERVRRESDEAGA